VEEPGVYTITLNQCDVESTQSITIYDASFTASLSASDTLFCQDYEFTNGLNEVQLTVNPSDVSILWSNGITQDESISVSTSGLYYAILTNQYGCEARTDSIAIVGVNCNDELPNVITANADGNNDLFIIDEALLLSNNRLLIINRWGNVILDERGYRNTFDGLNCTDGVYFYFFYPDYDLDSKIVKRGFLHIIH
jgi:PKD repeat protein